MKDLGQKIKKIRRLKGFKRADMAKELQISLSAYSRIEKEEVKIYLETLDKLAKVFKMEIKDILNFDENAGFTTNNKSKKHVAKTNDFETVKKLLIQINKKLDSQRKEIDLLKKKIKI
jgi:transcriptional regulator with XRE-family HTH domain